MQLMFLKLKHQEPVTGLMNNNSLNESGLYPEFIYLTSNLVNRQLHFV